MDMIISGIMMYLLLQTPVYLFKYIIAVYLFEYIIAANIGHEKSVIFCVVRAWQLLL